ncbi:MAG TPA: hypothetical protein H9910_01400 [Candidatus Mediterraneibacter quadrami]|uniref:Tail specific protease domain-containing protein n=1 Tax=Candidatus Mediterraneibacter quadrami TaxID=2838684 RepID=A0A9D2U6L7_9FIRM|nr:hypothetical protein [Candidatus Mediterraneibacter quadrami]
MKRISKRGLSIIGLAAILGAVLLLTVSLFLRFKPLPRDKDKEFENGSKIERTVLSEVQEESLYKLCKVWGYVKYRHPLVVSGDINWDAELFRVMPEVLKSENCAATNEILLDWLQKFPYDVKDSKETKNLKSLQDRKGLQVADTAWIEDKEFLGNELSRYLCDLSQIYILTREDSYAPFENQSKVTFHNEKRYPVEDTDMGMKLLGLFRFWNMYEYYSPNVDITVKDWDTVLKESIPVVAESSDYRSYVLAIAQTAAMTGDAHITISDKEQILEYYYGDHFLPCSIKMVDGQAVVTQTAQSNCQLKPGDILLEIDGMTMEERIEEQKKYQAIPESDKILYKMRNLLLQSKKEQAEVRIARGESEETVQITTQNSPYAYQNPIENGLLKENTIGYIDPSVLKEGELQKLMDRFHDTNGIIIDLRYYPSVYIPYLLGEYIVPTQKVFTIMTTPNPAMPGAYLKSELVVGKEQNLKEDELYRGEIILLMNEESISRAEFTIMALRQAPKATVVGSPSLGADGDIVECYLPGQIRMYMTGLGVYTPQGEPTQRCGLEPDVECYPTVEGIRDGRDELIEKAIDIIESV